jgi:hypothetical protein
VADRISTNCNVNTVNRSFSCFDRLKKISLVIRSRNADGINVLSCTDLPEIITGHAICIAIAFVNDLLCFLKLAFAKRRRLQGCEHLYGLRKPAKRFFEPS